VRWWDFLAGQCPGVPEENSRYLPRRVPGELVEGVPQLVVMRGVRAEHDDRGVPVPQVGAERGPLRTGDGAVPAVVRDVGEQGGGRAGRGVEYPSAVLVRAEAGVAEGVAAEVIPRWP
jgi:hypothetical protein